MFRSKNNGSQFLLTVFCSLVAVGINYLISIILTSYVTENIGTEAYGFVALAKTFASYASILTIALNTFSARYITIEYHKGNFDKVNKYYNTVFFADIIIGFVILAAMSVIVYFLENIISIPIELVADVKILFLLNIINYMVLSCCTVFMTATTIKNRLDLDSLIKCLSYIVEGIFLVLVFIYLKPHVYYVGFGLIVSSVAIWLLNYIFSKKSTPELRINKNDFSIIAAKEIIGAGIWNSINSLGNILNTGLDLLISNMMLSAMKAGQLAIVKTISTIFSSMFQLLARPFQPIQLRLYAEEKKQALVESFKRSIKVNGVLSNIAFAGFTVFGSVYYRLWTPSQDINLLQSVTIVTITGSIIEGAVYPLYYVYTLTVKNKIPCVITVISGLLNVVGMFILIKYFNAGIYGVVVTTTVLTWIVNFVFNPMYAANCLGVGKTVFYPTLIRHILSCIVITLVYCGISKIYYPSSWTGLLIVAIFASVIGAVIHFLIVISKEERISMIKQMKYALKNR